MHITNLLKSIRESGESIVRIHHADMKALRHALGCEGDDATGFTAPERGGDIIERDKTKKGTFSLNGALVEIDNSVPVGTWALGPKPAPVEPDEAA